MSDSANIARHLPLMASQRPTAPALKIPRGRSKSGEIDYLVLSFSELDLEVAAWSARFRSRGIAAGDRALLMVPQGLPLIAAAFALFSVGAVPVVIDPGMGLKNFLACVERSRPKALIGIPLARVLSRLFRRRFRSVQTRVAASGSPLGRLSGPKSDPLRSAPAPRCAPDLAAILFTSGSTGAPKGVCYEHGMFESQVALIRDTYAIESGEIDLPMLPIFALFNPALGMTTIVPEIDPRRPAAVEPAKIVQAVRQEGVTNSFGSPTLWGKVGQYCIDKGITLPTLKRVLCAGAPVPAKLWEHSPKFLPRGKLHSPYGATEALPVSSICADEVDSRAVRGACVGKPVAGVRVKVVRISEGPFRTLLAAPECGPGETGEIVVSGPNVTRTYDGLSEATETAKIPDGDVVWHRMGDCGYLDSEGKLWFCGRKVERVQSPEGPLFTEPCEQVFRQHAAVGRCALIGVGVTGAQKPALVVELDGQTDNSRAVRLAQELRQLAKEHAHTAGIALFYFHPSFPVDVRHNAKIHRLTLANWAQSQKAVEVV